MVDNTIQLLLSIDIGQSADVDELERLTHGLRREIEELDVDAVDLVRKVETPEGTMAGGLIVWGSLLVTLAASGGVIVTLINAIQSWLTRRERSSVTIEIGGDKLVLTGGPYSEEQRMVIDAFMSRNRGFLIGNDR